jgi:hypothetical protein
MKLHNEYYVKNLDLEERGGFSAFDPNTPRKFVLSPERDPAALAALLTYAEFCEPELAADIEAWVADIKEHASKGELRLGEVGATNAQHLMAQRADGPGMDGQAREHTLQHAKRLKGGQPWPRLSFLMGEG